MRFKLCAIVSAMMFLGCGGGSNSQSSASSGASSGQELEGFDTEGFEETEPQVQHGTASARELLGIQGPEQPWSSMNYADREMYMVAYVLPIHSEIFAEHDAGEYAQFTCESCHGEDGAERRYAMPSRYLPSLPPEGSPAWETARARNPSAWSFMADQVLPIMRTQLGQPELTCFSCHQRIGG